MMTFRSNNKVLGGSYEREVVKLLSQEGYWSHRLEENHKGAQPFDVIAVKGGVAFAIDCKTLDEKEKYFYISRLEDNQVLAFEKWMACGNSEPMVFVKYCGETYVIRYLELKALGKIDMRYAEKWGDK